MNRESPVNTGAAEPRRLRGTGRGRVLTLAAFAAVLAVLAGCAAVPPPAPRLPAPGAASAAAGSAARARAVSGSAAGAGAAASCNPESASLAPDGPPEVTPGSTMAMIRKRGYLIAGVDQSTYHFGYLNPLDGKIEGFDIDMIQAVAKAIFGNADKVEYKAIPDAQRIPDILNDHVDIVAHTMTITCQRLTQVDFSSVYFEAHQRVLIPSDSTATAGLADLGGQKVCATTGSDSVTTIEDYPSHPKVVQEPYWTDCLLMLQQDQVAAVSTDDSILHGLAAQDPFTKVVGPALTNEPYGLAMSKKQPDFVRFVNAVLAQERSDGDWKASYKRWVGTPVEQPPVAQYAS
jgi:polar amino acid transport system substrate-binding protein